MPEWLELYAVENLELIELLTELVVINFLRNTLIKLDIKQWPSENSHFIEPTSEGVEIIWQFPLLQIINLDNKNIICPGIRVFDTAIKGSFTRTTKLTLLRD